MLAIVDELLISLVGLVGVIAGATITWLQSSYQARRKARTDLYVIAFGVLEGWHRLIGAYRSERAQREHPEGVKRLKDASWLLSKRLSKYWATVPTLSRRRERDKHAEVVDEMDTFVTAHELLHLSDAELDELERRVKGWVSEGGSS